jgi:cysteine-rich repeat protein
MLDTTETRRTSGRNQERLGNMSRGHCSLLGYIALIFGCLACAGCSDDSGGGGQEPSVCGDSVCEGEETDYICPEDCGCGNGIVNEGEECDSDDLDGETCVSLGYGGGSLSCTDGCTYSTLLCQGSLCGDGRITAGEQCDGENLNDRTCMQLGYDGGTLACSAQCQLDVTGCSGEGCGDGVVNGDEECDGDDLGGMDCTDVGYAEGTLSCDSMCAFDISGCEVPLNCGNGVVDEDEECDDEGESAYCDADCTLPECGDGLVNATVGEECDDGGESASCDEDCTAAECGDGTVNLSAGEDCDDATATAACDADCTPAECGDGTVNPHAGEECDDGGETATCDVDCTLPECGDGALNVAAGEECDDGGESAACDGDCTPSECGDGTLNVSAGEECDDGNLVDDDGCDSDCTNECGNGLPDPGEECDDGGETATCDVDCTLPECGDGTLNVSAGEECDDGNLISGDSCDASCISECTPTSITTTFDGGNSFDGNIFELVALQDLVISSFDVNLGSGTHDMEIYYRQSTYSGFEDDPTAWTLLETVTGVVSNGSDVATPLDIDLGLAVAAGETISLYITTTGTTMSYTNGTTEGNVLVSNSDLEVREGLGVEYPFASSYSPRVWNGTIYYDACN